MENKFNVLIADDEKEIISVLRLFLEKENITVYEAYDGEMAHLIMQRFDIDLAIIDIMMPRMNGYELIRRVRSVSSIPILVISAKKEDSDKILGLDLGADDYLVKPFNPLEVLARVRSAVRRSYDLSGAAEDRDPESVSYADLRIDLAAMQLYKGDREIDLTPTELKILLLFMKNPGRVYTKVQISKYLNGEYYDADEKTIMVHISNLREKIEENPKRPRYILTVRGLGYKLGRIS